MLGQVALSFVLCRIQGASFQTCALGATQGFNDAQLAIFSGEISNTRRSANLICANLCTAGELKDPANKKPIKKALNIATTSRSMFGSSLDPLKCAGNHEHQVIEGATFAHGQSMSRSSFSELYSGQGRVESEVSMCT
jgi:hypothetical protein